MHLVQIIWLLFKQEMLKINVLNKLENYQKLGHY